MAAERYLSRRIPDLRVGNNIDEIDKKLIPASIHPCFKLEVLKDSHCETAQFWARYMDIIQMVLTLIRATRKTTLNCMSALSVCLVPNVHCK